MSQKRSILEQMYPNTFTLEIRYSFENKHKKLDISSKKEKFGLYIPTTHPPIKKSLLPYHVFL